MRSEDIGFIELMKGLSGDNRAAVCHENRIYTEED